MLELKNVWIAYDKNVAVRDLTLIVKKGDFVTVLGANGAGKSSTLNAISGVVSIQKGEVNFKGERIDGLSPKAIAAKGIIQIPEGRRLFPLMTVRENLLMGAFLRKDRREIANSMDKLMALFPAIKTKLHSKARELSGGQQQMVAIARGLMAVPELLMLDEPSLGLSPLLRQQLAEIIKTVSHEGTTMVLIEQNARLGLMLANYGYVMENGEFVLQGKADELMQDSNVKKAYLGV